MVRFIFILSIFYLAGDINAVTKTTIPYENKCDELCRIGQNFFKQIFQPIPSCKQFQSPNLLKLANTEFSIQNNSILFDGKLENCLQSLKQLNKEIRSKQGQTRNFITLNYDGSSYIFQTDPLGEGERGIVYPLKHKNHVIKISKNDLKSMRILQEEKDSSDFWHKVSKDPNINFSVPQKVKEHPLGFFSVMERIDGQRLTEVLILLVWTNHI
ncbi:MAG: hypothetical protein AB8G05_23300 [Oligoflexales bacterium]